MISLKEAEERIKVAIELGKILSKKKQKKKQVIFAAAIAQKSNGLERNMHVCKVGQTNSNHGIWYHGTTEESH